MEKLERLSAAGGNRRWFTAVGNMLAGPQKPKHRIIMWPSNSTVDTYPNELETDTQTSVCMSLYVNGNTINTTQKAGKSKRFPTDERSKTWGVCIQ